MPSGPGAAREGASYKNAIIVGTAMTKAHKAKLPNARQSFSKLDKSSNRLDKDPANINNRNPTC